MIRLGAKINNITILLFNLISTKIRLGGKKMSKAKSYNFEEVIICIECKIFLKEMLKYRKDHSMQHKSSFISKSIHWCTVTYKSRRNSSFITEMLKRSNQKFLKVKNNIKIVKKYFLFTCIQAQKIFLCFHKYT